MTDLLSASDIGEFLAEVRRRQGLSKQERGVLLDRSAQTILAYESGRCRPPVVLLLDLLDRLPMLGCTFNEVAARFSYRQVVSIDPWRFPSLHEYVAGVRVFCGYRRAEFAVLRRLACRHLRPEFSYADLVRRFETLRPSRTPCDSGSCSPNYVEQRQTAADAPRCGTS